jgi:hypothetical protein
MDCKMASRTAVDVLEQQIAAQPDVELAIHADREWFRVTLIRPLPADKMLARYIRRAERSAPRVRPPARHCDPRLRTRPLPVAAQPDLPQSAVG